VQEWGYDVSGLVAGLGVGGLAVSLAAQDTLANLFGFTMIVGDRPFVVGEFIKTPDVEGIVEHVGMRSTRVRQLDQAYVTIPNAKLADSAILNWSRLSKRRLDARLCIRYDARPEQLEALLERSRALLNAHEKTEPESVVVYLIEYGENGLIVLVRANLLLPDWIEFTAEKEKLFIDILKIVEELGLSIAFPSRSVYIETGASRLTEAHSETPPSIEGE
jgi:MscS family membrane protein